MGELRCPTCGKSNPVEAEVCRHCQSRLEPPAGESAGSGLPDWLDSLRRDNLDLPAGDPSQEDSPGWPDELPPLSEERDRMAGAGTPLEEGSEPDWLQRIQARQNLGDVEPAVLSAPGEDPSASQEGGSPSGLLPPFESGEGGEGFAEIPDWLANAPGEGEHPQEAPGDFPAQSAEPAPDLAPAEIPNWVEALRPVEAAAAVPPRQDEADRSVQSSGPLSGLRGVLPAEPDITLVTRPKVYSSLLQVTENQQAHIALLEELIKTEGQVLPIPSQPSISSQAVLRLLIFFVLVLGIAWPVYTGSRAVPLPSLPVEVDDVSTRISALSSRAPVLLSVDYQPGLSPEMDAAADAVVDHLMIKGAYLTLVTTTPTGPAQAERLVRLVNRLGGHQYAGLEQFTNLGFIPGGAAGLLGFAETPRRILPFSQAGSFAWDAAPLQDVERIGDFALVLVITDNPDTARSWIEQVQPALGNTPLLMVLSAQAEPVVRPYYDGSPRQVSGFVAGLAGGAAYENLQARMGLARKYWDSFSSALTLAGALILIGGAANLLSSGLAHRKKAPGGKQV